MADIKVIGSIAPELLAVLERAGWAVEVYPDPLDLQAEDIEGLSPVLLADVGQYTARGLHKGLMRDVQATRRFFADALAGERESDASEQELRALIDFSQAVSRSLARAEIVDGAARFLQQSAAAAAVAIHTVGPEGLTLARAFGFSEAELVALTAWLGPVVREDNLAFRQGIQPGRDRSGQRPPAAVSAIVPVSAKDALVGALSVRTAPSFPLSLDTLKAMGRQLALSLHHADLFAQASEALESLRRAQQSMGQSEKLAAVGLLAAGIAHEINNPASFIITNLTVLGQHIEDVLAYAGELEKLAPPQEQPRVAALEQRFDVDYLRQDVPDLIARCLKGMQRIHEIVRDLRSFAHKGAGEAELADVNPIIHQVLKMAGGELRHRARVELDLRPVPRVELEPTPLSQVLLNLIINAYQSFGERPKAENMIWVGTRADERAVQITVADNGSGMTPEVLEHLFEPFFTTKPVGTGTGLGLAVSHELIKKMGGQIRVESAVGRGTRFTVELPIR